MTKQPKAEPHSYTPDGSRYCKVCGCPPNNAIHMTKQPNIDEVDLIKIRTIKQKHFDQLPAVNQEAYQPDNYDHLYTVNRWGSVLARDKSNGYLVKIDRMVIIEFHLRTSAGVREGQQAADAFCKSLPQLFLD
jgi:hypothetical protein